MSTTATTKTRKTRSKKTPISPALRTMSLADTLDAFAALDNQFAVAPRPARERMSRLTADVVTVANQIGIDDASGLLTHQKELLAALTGIGRDNLTTFLKSDIAGPLHEYRNVTVAMVAAAAASIGASTEPVYRSSVRLRARTHQLQRPFTDDEILLARVQAAIESLHNPDSQRANIYTLTDAGLTPGETTSFTLGDFDDVKDPAEVLAPGNGHLKCRLLPLDGFGQQLLFRCATSATIKGTAPTTLLTYTPRTNLPGTAAASASAQGVLDRMLSEVGLANTDVTASSITLWRVHSTWAEHGTDIAWQVSGRSTPEQMLTMLFRTPPR
ncbi:hypothetical protein GCM10025782_20370 [Pedococcus ginsenosidimutans]|uniref:DUF222 domain-containing protein n=1 Tax=Pedococcus ginsenosidimutans TaxID=490570 RepID=A0ABP8Y650_9MICO